MWPVRKMRNLISFWILTGSYLLSELLTDIEDPQAFLDGVLKSLPASSGDGEEGAASSN